MSPKVKKAIVKKAVKKAQPVKAVKKEKKKKGRPKVNRDLHYMKLIGAAAETLQHHSKGEFLLPSSLVRENGVLRREQYVPVSFVPPFYTSDTKGAMLIYEFQASQAIEAVVRGGFPVRKKRFDPKICRECEEFE